MPPAAASNSRMKPSPMALRFSSGSMTPASRSKKRSAARTWIISMRWVRANSSTTCSHEAGVDVDAGELRAHGPVHERGGHRRVDAPAERAQHPLGADLGPDRL